MPKINTMLLRSFFIAVTCAFGAQSFAKDVESMQAEEQDEKSAMDNAADGAALDDQDTSAQDEKKLETEDNQTTDASSDEGSESDVTVKSVGVLDGKLFLGTTFGWVSTSGSKGNYRSLGASDITAGYLLPKQFVPGFQSYGFARFLPVSVTADYNLNNYTGVINYFSFGLRTAKDLKKKIKIYGEAGISVFQSRLDPVNEAADSADLEMTGAALNFAAGADYMFMKKVSMGPRIGGALGNYKFFQFALSFDFLM